MMESEEDKKRKQAILKFAELTRKNHPEFDNLYLFGEGDEERDALIMSAFILQSGDCPVCGQLMNIGVIADNTFWFCLKCREQRACTGMKYKKGKAEEDLYKKCLERQKFCKHCEGHKKCYEVSKKSSCG